MKKIKFIFLSLLILGCYSLETTEDIDDYVLYINNRNDTTEKVKVFDTPNSDRKSTGKTKVVELHDGNSNVLRTIVDIDTKELDANYKFYYDYGNLVYCELTEYSIDKISGENMVTTDDIYYFTEGQILESNSKINKPENPQRALLLSKFYFVDN